MTLIKVKVIILKVKCKIFTKIQYDMYTFVLSYIINIVVSLDLIVCLIGAIEGPKVDHS